MLHIFSMALGGGVGDDEGMINQAYVDCLFVASEEMLFFLNTENVFPSLADRSTRFANAISTTRFSWVVTTVRQMSH